MLDRVEKLEEDFTNSVTIIWVLSRQLEKLGIHFWVLSKALKEPIAEVFDVFQVIDKFCSLYSYYCLLECVLRMKKKRF